MKQSEALKLLATLAAAYPRTALAQETIEVYAHDLRDIDAGLAAAAIERVRKSSRFFPTIAEIREAAAELSLAAPTPMEAWGLALERAAWRPVWGKCSLCPDACGFTDVEREVICSACRGEGKVATNQLPPLHPSVQEAMELTTDGLGWRNTETPQLRRAFLDAYADVKRRAILGFVAPHPALERGQAQEVAAGVPLPQLGSL